ncbi:hypothetical protein L596_029445 [Steinernema carpocapsae]|uniref:Uncharacterized protein n=1 Tax=Steinernema carpocapsae TaxID=34508 RepID=A0A4U5LUN7_STECR|nr:hypothetical protein L596_029445 [Steinernema carpocapsae]
MIESFAIQTTLSHKLEGSSLNDSILIKFLKLSYSFSLVEYASDSIKGAKFLNLMKERNLRSPGQIAVVCKEMMHRHLVRSEMNSDFLHRLSIEDADCGSKTGSLWALDLFFQSKATPTRLHFDNEKELGRH